MGLGRVGGLERGSTLYRLLGEDQVVWEFAPVAHLRRGRLCGQSQRGAFGSEGLVAGEHPPDRLGEAVGDVDLGDLGAALFAEALFVALVAVAVDLVAAGVGGCLHQRPA